MTRSSGSSTRSDVVVDVREAFVLVRAASLAVPSSENGIHHESDRTGDGDTFQRIAPPAHARKDTTRGTSPCGLSQRPDARIERCAPNAAPSDESRNATSQLRRLPQIVTRLSRRGSNLLRQKSEEIPPRFTTAHFFRFRLRRYASWL